jgi:hypothetical protein
MQQLVRWSDGNQVFVSEKKRRAGGLMHGDVLGKERQEKQAGAMGDVVMSATPVRPRPHGAVHSAGSRQIGPHPSHPCQALALVRPRALQPDAGGDADADADVEAEAEAAAATKMPWPMMAPRRCV